MRRRTLSIVLVLFLAACGQSVGVDGDRAVIALGAPTTIDPAAMGDAASASIAAQFFETLTAFDADQHLQPALAESWRIEEGGTRVVFRMRPDLTFSDGTALRASDVVRSWLRLIDPAHPSPLASLMFDVRGAAERIRGEVAEDAVGLRADDANREVIVDLVRPAADLVAIVSGPSFGVVPPGVGVDDAALVPGEGFVASGGYRPVEIRPDRLILEGNPRYWAGLPAIPSIEIVTDLGGGSPVEAFEDGLVDYIGISGFDASWVAYDPEIGPQLRDVPSLSTDYYGFDTTAPPFDDVRVRQAFAAAVDWRRIARLALPDDAGVATSMVPPGIPGRSDFDAVPEYDPVRARSLLAEAGYPGGAGFPAVTMLTGGVSYDAAIVDELERELGVRVSLETMDFGNYFDRLDTDPPQMWALSWVADYPGRNDFLGVLLGTGATNNYGGWSSAEFDEAIEEAVSGADAAVAGAAFDRAEAVVRREAPVVPISYGTGWALSRDGLLGAGQNGMGIVRLAGLAWAS